MYVLIYGLIDPFTQQLRYVGKTTKTLKQRWHVHRATARTGAKYFVCRWWRKVEAAGGKPEIFEIERVPKSEWQQAERFWISYFRFVGCHLTNHAPGGDGTDGYRWSEEQKAAQSRRIKESSAAMQSLAIARKRTAELAAAGALKGTRPRTQEWNEKILTSNAALRAKGLYKKKGPVSDVARQNIRTAAQKSHAKPEFRARMSVSKKGQRRSQESEAQRVVSWKSAHEAKKNAGIRRWSPEGYAKMVAAQKRRRERERALGIPGAPPPRADVLEKLQAGRRRRAAEQNAAKAARQEGGLP